MYFGRRQDALLPGLPGEVPPIDEKDEPLSEQFAHGSLGSIDLIHLGKVPEYVTCPPKGLPQVLPILHCGVGKDVPLECLVTVLR